MQRVAGCRAQRYWRARGAIPRGSRFTLCLCWRLRCTFRSVCARLPPNGFGGVGASRDALLAAFGVVLIVMGFGAAWAVFA